MQLRTCASIGFLSLSLLGIVACEKSPANTSTGSQSAADKIRSDIDREVQTRRDEQIAAFDRGEQPTLDEEYIERLTDLADQQAAASTGTEALDAQAAAEMLRACTAVILSYDKLVAELTESSPVDLSLIYTVSDIEHSIARLDEAARVNREVMEFIDNAPETLRRIGVKNGLTAHHARISAQTFIDSAQLKAQRRLREQDEILYGAMKIYLEVLLREVGNWEIQEDGTLLFTHVRHRHVTKAFNSAFDTMQRVAAEQEAVQRAILTRSPLPPER